jgi:hypothetical protein
VRPGTDSLAVRATAVTFDVISTTTANGSRPARAAASGALTAHSLLSERHTMAATEAIPTTVWRTNPVVALWSTMVGKKVVMAVTGAVLVAFVIGHMVGNLKIFLGADAIDTYAVFLRTMGEPLVPYSVLLWVVRVVLLTCVALHITAAVQLTRMNWAARPESYDTKQSIATTHAARMMGTIILLRPPWRAHGRA